MGLRQKLSLITDRLREVKLAFSCVMWAISAVFSALFEIRKTRSEDDPYWAEDGKSETIRALKF